MDAKTLKALKGSIKKWEKIVAGTGKDAGRDNCPLCAMFFRGKSPCKKCPVMKSTGQDNCCNTPYGAWSWEAFRDGVPAPCEATTPRLKQLAKAELEFLRSLLPKKRKKPCKTSSASHA